MKALPVFDPKLPKDLENLPITLLWRGTNFKVESVGFRVKGEDGLPVEEQLDVNDAPEKAQEVFETKIFPMLRKMFADELEEREVDNGSKPKESIRSELADTTPAESAGRRRGKNNA